MEVTRGVKLNAHYHYRASMFSFGANCNTSLPPSLSLSLARFEDLGKARARSYAFYIIARVTLKMTLREDIIWI